MVCLIYVHLFAVARSPFTTAASWSPRSRPSGPVPRAPGTFGPGREGRWVTRPTPTRSWRRTRCTTQEGGWRDALGEPGVRQAGRTGGRPTCSLEEWASPTRAANAPQECPERPAARRAMTRSQPRTAPRGADVLHHRGWERTTDLCCHQVSGSGQRLHAPRRPELTSIVTRAPGVDGSEPSGRAVCGR
jgi:hypothetical protein